MHASKHATRAVGAMLVGALGVTACAHDTPDTRRGRTESRADPIIRGAVSAADQDAVVLLTMYDGDYLSQRCTGTLVAPNLVLTARHCTTFSEDTSIQCSSDGSSTAGGRFKDDRDPKQMFVYTGAAAAAAADVRGPPAARGTRLVYDENARSMCGGDVAFIVLDRRIASAKTAPIRLDRNARVGETLTLVGYGVTEEGKVPDLRLVRDSTVTDVGPSVRYGLSVSEYTIGEGHCRGDSGGPAFDATGAVIGVLSRGGGGSTPAAELAQGCVGPDAVSIHTNLHTMRAIVARAFELSGNTLEAPPPLSSDNVVAPSAPENFQRPKEGIHTSEDEESVASAGGHAGHAFDSGCHAPSRSEIPDEAILAIVALVILSARARRYA
jgi:V8-like Glu-specific endopeptidase